MIKKALCIQGSGGNGKTRTIRLILDNLLHRGATLTNWADTIFPVADKNADCCVIIDYCGKRIGIESQGDPYSRQASSLKKFVEQQCDVIVCACRSKRTTVYNVQALTKSDYEIIWTSNLVARPSHLWALANQHSADFFAQVIDDLARQ